jgi:hypothetical protein
MCPNSTEDQDSATQMEEVINNGPFPIRFPPKGLPQDEEWCEVQIDGKWKRIRFHDYHEVYKVPGLYETIFYRTLRCNSPNRVSSFLNDVAIELGLDLARFRAIDIGAGNGMSGEALQNLGVRKIVGIDLLPEAKEAVLRDRPWVYDHYLVADLTTPSPEEGKFLQEYRFNLLCTIAALGFGDIPPLAFFNAFNLLDDNALIAFNIRDKFLKKEGGSPFARLINAMLEKEVIELELLKRYQHRLNTQGEPIYYVGIVARKNRSMGREFLV